MPIGCEMSQPKPYVTCGIPNKTPREYALSILICHLCARKDLLERLLAVLKPQIGYASDDFIGSRYFESVDHKVQVIIEEDNGRSTVGAKRNRLLEQATGKMVCHVDDDDLVSTDYVAKILKAAESNPSVIGIEGTIFPRKGPAKKFIHSMKYTGWYEKDSIYYRFPNHINPVSREVAKNVKFPELSHGEDRVWSEQIQKYLSTEVFVDGPIYYYHPHA